MRLKTQEQKNIIKQDLETLENFISTYTEEKIKEAAGEIFEKIKINFEIMEAAKDDTFAARFKMLLIRTKEIVKYSAEQNLEEKKHCFGSDFPDKIFYIIRRKPPGSGLLSNFHWVLNHIIYAIFKGYIPVVDMQNYKTLYHEKDLLPGKEKLPKNDWEYYFEQPCGYSLKDIEKAQNVIWGNLDNYIVHTGIQFPDPYSGELNISRYYKLISKYCPLSYRTINEFQRKEKILFANKKKIIGVLQRGTDYKIARLHQTPASLEQTIEKTQYILKDKNFNYIFLCTEEQESVDKFREVFPKEKLIISDSNRIKNFERGIVPNIFRISYSPYQNGLGYLTDMILLSRCDGIIASKTNGTTFALGLNNNKYKFSHIFDFGINP